MKAKELLMHRVGVFEDSVDLIHVPTYLISTLVLKDNTLSVKLKHFNFLTLIKLSALLITGMLFS